MLNKKKSNRGLLVEGLRPSKHPLYGTWMDMHRRCYDVKNKLYPYYGGRGIGICERWFSFVDFVSDMGAKPTPLHTVDRSKNDEDYSPDNCRWATKSEQARNRRARSDSPFGVHGVTERHGKFHVTSTVDGMMYALGVYPTLEEAVAARTEFDKAVSVDFDRAMGLVKGRELPETGVRGVYNYLDGRFVARVYVNKKSYNLGIFNTIDEAKRARQEFLAKQAA